MPPIPLEQFRIEAKQHLEKLLVSIKAKNKVVTVNVNRTKRERVKIRRYSKLREVSCIWKRFMVVTNNM